MIDLGTVESKEDRLSRRENISEKQRLGFTYYLLAIVFLMFTMAFAGLFIKASVVEKVFNSIMTLVTATMSSIITYYYKDSKK